MLHPTHILHIRKRLAALRDRLVREEGFSLLELLIVIVIIGILGTIVYTRFMDLPERAKKEAAKQQILIFKTAMDRYRLDHDAYPPSEEGIDAIKQYLQSGEVPNDPWGSPYQYRNPGENNREYDIVSPGPDRQEGTDDDVRSWELHRSRSDTPKND
jgi:general secretion pathway protein G